MTDQNQNTHKHLSEQDQQSLDEFKKYLASMDSKSSTNDVLLQHVEFLKKQVVELMESKYRESTTSNAITKTPVVKTSSWYVWLTGLVLVAIISFFIATILNTLHIDHVIKGSSMCFITKVVTREIRGIYRTDTKNIEISCSLIKDYSE